jgi:hypothetical protein
MRTGARYIGAIPFLLALTLLATTGQALGDTVDVLALSHDFTSLPRTRIVVSPVPQPSKDEGKLEVAESLGRIMTEELVTTTRFAQTSRTPRKT